jgi:hypothetical protein
MENATASHSVNQAPEVLPLAEEEPRAYDAPAVVDLALAFLRGNSAGVALNSLLGKTTSLVMALRARAKLLKMVHRLSSAKGDDEDMLKLGNVDQRRKLADALSKGGLRMPSAGLPAQMPRADVREWVAALHRLQLKNMAEFEQIKRNVDRDAGELHRFIEISEHLLRQLPGLSPQESKKKT